MFSYRFKKKINFANLKQNLKLRDFDNERLTTLPTRSVSVKGKITDGIG